MFALGDHGSFTGAAGRAGGCGDTARHGSNTAAGLLWTGSTVEEGTGVHGSTAGVGDATVEPLGTELVGLLHGSFY